MSDVRFIIIFVFTVKFIVCSNHDEFGGLELIPSWLSTYRYVDENYSVTCRSFENYKNLTWINGEGKVITEKSSKIKTLNVQYGSVLIFENIQLEAEGRYTCISRDDIGRQSPKISFTLNVAEPIVFTSPTVFETILNDDVFLECKVSEKLISLRHWEFEGDVLPSDERYEYRKEGLQIRNVRLENAGKYYCVIAHSPFQTTRNMLEITLVVYTKPILPYGKRIDNTAYGFIDEITSLICEVTANPPARFVWYEGNEKVLNPKNDYVTIENENNTSILNVTLIKGHREFVCESCNELGCLNQTLSLQNTTKLQKPEIGLWKLDSDMVEFFVTYQKEAKYYLFEYFYDVYDEQWKKSFYEKIYVGLRKPSLNPYMNFNITRLYPDTKYVVRVAAGNNFTLSEFSAERKFKTKFGRAVSVEIICCATNNQKYNLFLLIFLVLIVL